MKGIILLNSNENTRQIEEEEKAKFVKSVLETIGIPVEGLWDENGALTPQNAHQLRRTLASYNTVVIDDGDGGLKIHVDKEVVANWKKPTYILKRDPSQIDPKKKLFLEMAIDCWTIFENIDG